MVLSIMQASPTPSPEIVHLTKLKVCTVERTTPHFSSPQLWQPPFYLCRYELDKFKSLIKVETEQMFVLF